MVSKLISTVGLLALVIGITMCFGIEGMRWLWLLGGISASVLCFWLAWQVERTDK